MKVSLKNTRLIDAQDTFNVLTDYYHNSTHIQHLALQEALNKVPTVDAIPISFIEEQVKLCNEIGFRRGEDCYIALIEKWREKNGTETD